MAVVTTSPARRPFALKPLHIAAIGIVLVAVVFGVFGLKDAFRPYTTSVAEAEGAGRSVQLAGFLGSKGEYDEQKRWTFMLQDENGAMVKVVSNETRPPNFEQAISVVAIGRYDRGQQAFMAEKLLVKCPSKYQEQLETARN